MRTNLAPSTMPSFHSHFAFRRVLTLALAVSVLGSAEAQSIAVERGNVVFNRGEDRRVLTNSGHDSEPSLSHDGRLVVFVRATPGRKIAAGSGEVDANEIWLIGTDGRGERRLVRGSAHADPKRLLTGLQSPQFSPDGRRIYFLSAAWATSSAVHVFDLAIGREHYLCAGNSLEMLRSGKYRGHLIVLQHRYCLGGGSYDWHWLLRPNGREVGPIGEDPAAFIELHEK